MFKHGDPTASLGILSRWLITLIEQIFFLISPGTCPVSIFYQYFNLFLSVVRSPEGHPHTGLHKNNCGQQIEGGDSATLLCSGKTSPGVLRPALEPVA